MNQLERENARVRRELTNLQREHTRLLMGRPDVANHVASREPAQIDVQLDSIADERTVQAEEQPLPDLDKKISMEKVVFGVLLSVGAAVVFAGGVAGGIVLTPVGIGPGLIIGGGLGATALVVKAADNFSNVTQSPTETKNDNPRSQSYIQTNSSNS